MAHSGSGDTKSPQILLHLLCNKITGLKDDALAPYYKIALTTLGSNIASPAFSDEFEVSEKIKKKLARQGREKDAATFAELHRKLQGQGSHGKGAFVQGLKSQAMSTPYPGRWGATPGNAPPSAGMTMLSSHTMSSGGTSGISSIHSSHLHSADPTPQSFAPSYAPTPYDPRQHKGFLRTPGMALRLGQNTETTQQESAVALRGKLGLSTVASSRTTGSSRRGADNTAHELPETLLLREIVYIFQGIEGKYIKFEMNKEGFRIDPKAGIPRAVRKIVSKLSECGWLYNKVRKYADSRSTDRAFGLVGQSFCAALHQELTDYYRLMAVLESQLHQEEDLGVSADSPQGLSLRQLAVWTCDPLVRLKALAALVDVCQGKKGGALASAIHSYIQHGDPSIRALVKHTLTLVAQPIFSTIMRWIYDGELEDTYHEFFVASDPTVKDDRLWHDKYSLRKSMIPSFITGDQAKKMLLTGKSINFLRQVCQDRTAIRTRDVVKAAETNQVESIFTQDMDAFPHMIDTVYKETSSHLLEVLHVKYKFMDHLKAMRRYLLLGQGDFIRHLMDLLEDDLAKPAGTLFMHNLTGILETAIRATNAQYDDSDILKRLDVRLLEVSPGDTGWDVFSLDYHVDGPIRTVFTPECMIIYLRVFNFLWRAKRMEYILDAIWKEQMGKTRLLRSIPELSVVLHQGHVIGCEMIHFVQQVQYYLNFEVLECSWDELLQKVQSAKDLDHIIAAHQEFLDTINTRALLDTQSSNILTQLRTIFDLIIKFQKIQAGLYQAAGEEMDARQNYQDRIKRGTDKGKWGLTDTDEQEEMDRRAEFERVFIPTTRSQLRLLAESYTNMVQQFLVMLTSLSDISLRFLSVRLDFNENYKAKEPKLRTSLGHHQHKAKKKTEVVR